MNEYEFYNEIKEKLGEYLPHEILSDRVMKYDREAEKFIVAWLKSEILMAGKLTFGNTNIYFGLLEDAEKEKHNEILQHYSAIPIFIACNTESGGSDACTDGTFISSGIKIGAAGKNEYAYALGRISNEEASAVGCNMAFAPVCDISYNWANTEIISRAFGNNPDQVAEMSCQYLKGAHTIEGFACVAKHFPGNGVDFRDAHLSNNVNSFEPDRWAETYGKVYSTLIENDLEAVMAGHIMLPEVATAINPALKVDEIMPATLSNEIITGLLREQLGFSGLVITDASHMVGMTCRMKRKDMLPAAINAGCDMILFFNDPDEDFANMLNAYQSGIITKNRMHEALERILGLKAHMGLHRKNPDKLVPSEKIMLQTLSKREGLDIQKSVSEDGLTLVKYLDKDVLPLSPERYKRIMLAPKTLPISTSFFPEKAVYLNLYHRRILSLQYVMCNQGVQASDSQKVEEKSRGMFMKFRSL